jgi:hypothetical protein
MLPFLRFFHITYTPTKKKKKTYSPYSVTYSRENLLFGLLRWASATSGVAFRLPFVLYMKSIGRIYSTCNLQESNRRWVFSRNSLLAGPRVFRRADVASMAETRMSQTALDIYLRTGDSKSFGLLLLSSSLYKVCCLGLLQSSIFKT